MPPAAQPPHRTHRATAPTVALADRADVTASPTSSTGATPARVAATCGCTRSSRPSRRRTSTGHARRSQACTAPGLRDLKRIGLPHFTQVTFLSKLRMFLDPVCYAALDLKLAKLRFEQPSTLLHDLKVQPTSIPVTAHNEAVYAAWCAACQALATALGRERGWRAADVERGVFHLVDTGQAALAARLLARTTASVAGRGDRQRSVSAAIDRPASR